MFLIQYAWVRIYEIVWYIVLYNFIALYHEESHAFYQGLEVFKLSPIWLDEKTQASVDGYCIHVLWIILNQVMCESVCDFAEW